MRYYGHHPGILSYQLPLFVEFVWRNRSRGILCRTSRERLKGWVCIRKWLSPKELPTATALSLWSLWVSFFATRGFRIQWFHLAPVEHNKSDRSTESTKNRNTHVVLIYLRFRKFVSIVELSFQCLLNWSSTEQMQIIISYVRFQNPKFYKRQILPKLL